MTINLFSKRLKDAKKELTALKTSHERAASLLNIYSTQDTLPWPPGGVDIVTIIVHFSREYTAYPFFRFEIESLNFAYRNYASNIYIGAESYGADGYSIEIVALHWGDEEYSSNFRVISTSPVVRIDYNWD